MARTYTKLLYHVVFSTKSRQRLIAVDAEQRVWAYLGGIARENDVVPIQIGGIEDHVHLLLSISPAMTLSKTVQHIKGGSSVWIKDNFKHLWAFAWQDGYSAFTVSQSSASTVIKYIQGQREHHRTRTFEEEYRMLLDKHGIVYDEKFLLD